MDSILEIRNLSFSFGRRPVFQGVALRLMPQDVLCPLGPRRGRESTLLRIVAGLLPGAGGPSEFWGSRSLPPPRKSGRTFEPGWVWSSQEGALISNMSIYDNIALPLRYHTQAGEGEVGKRVGDLMNTLGIDREADRALPRWCRRRAETGRDRPGPDSGAFAPAFR